MKFYGHAEEVAAKIVEAFKTGNLPKALAPIFIRRKDNVPCRAWSWNNQLLCALSRTSDARGLKQWNTVGRSVKKGSKAIWILAPLFRTATVVDDKTSEVKEIQILYGFRSVPVFAIENTEGAELPKDSEVGNWLNSLPFIEVARAWGLNVDAYNGNVGAPKGRYRRKAAIAVGIKNLATWAHELLHAADDRLGNLKEFGQHWRSETVAELGGAILLEALGMDSESDRGGCFEYVQHYAADAGIDAVRACMDVLKRTCDAVNLVLTEAEKIAAANSPETPNTQPMNAA